jgi:PsbP
VRIAAAVALSLLLLGCGGQKAQPAATPSSPSTGGLIRHIDRDAGFSIDYPESWKQYQSQDPKVQFLVGPDGTDFVQVRIVAPLPVSIAPGDTQVMKRITDGLLAGQPIDIVQESQTTLAGLPGYEYVYRFKDASGQQGVHIHVFLFQGNRLITLVFQALPESRLKALAPAFDRVLSSFRVLPPAAATTPAASATPSP